MNTMSPLKKIQSLAVLLLLAASALPAATIYWDGSGGNSWNTLANWDTSGSGGSTPVAVPGSGDDVVFNASTVGTQISTLGGNRSANSLTFAANTATGITIANNTLTLGAGGLSFNSTGANHTISSAIDLSANQAWAHNGSNNVEISGVISGAFSLNKSGTGTGMLRITNIANTYTGPTTVSTGILSIGTTGSLPGWNMNGQVAVANGATLAVRGGVSDADIATMLGTTNFAAGASLGFDTTSDRTYTPVIADTAQGSLGLVKGSGNTLTLSGSNSNTYTGTTRVNDGGIRIDKASGFTAIPGTLVIGDGVGTFKSAFVNRTVANTSAIAATANITINQDGFLDLGGVSGMVTFNNLHINGGQFEGNGGGSTQPTTINGLTTITASSLTSSSNTLMIHGGNNSSVVFNGNINIASSPFQAYIGGTGSNLIYDFGGGARTISVADGAHAVDAKIVGNTGVGEPWWRNGSTVKDGAGTLEIGGNANQISSTFTGWTVSAGTLRPTGNNVLGNGANQSLLVGGGTLDLVATTHTVSGTTGLTLTGGTITGTTGTITAGTAAGRGFNVQSGGISAILAGTNVPMVKTTTGTVTLSGANTFTGNTAINAGTLAYARQVALYNNVGANWTDTKITVESAATMALNVGGVGGEFTTADVATLAALGTGSGGFKSGSFLGLDTSNASGGTFTHGSVIANPNAGANVLGVKKLGTNTLVLNSANSYTGATHVLGGILETSNLANGSANSGVGASANGASNLVLNGGTLRYTGGSVGTDRLFQVGDTLAGDAGTVESNGAGEVAFNNTGSLGYGTSNQTRSLNLAGTNTGANTLAAVIGDNGSGAVSLNKSGAGTWILAGNNSHSGVTTISGGILQIGAGGASGTLGTGAVVNNANLTVDRSGTYAMSNNMSGTGTLTKNGTGTLTLSGTNGFTGMTSVNAGKLTLSGGSHASLNYQIDGGSFEQVAGTAWSTDLFHANGFTSGATVKVADLADSSDGQSTLKFTAEVAGLTPLEITSANPFASYGGSAAAWAAEWEIDVDLTNDFGIGDFDDINVILSTGAFSPLALNGVLNLRARNEFGAYTLYANLSDGATVYLQSGAFLAKYTVALDADSFDLIYASARAIPEPGTFGLLAMAALILRWRFRTRGKAV